MRYDPDELGPSAIEFFTERHLATLTLSVSAEELHVTPVGFTWDDETATARVITFAASKKVRLLEAAGHLQAALGQVDGGRWATLYGSATVSADPVVCADAVRRYAARYRQPKDRGADRRTIEIRVDRIVGRIPD
ncbi:MAG: pyridoxamine 5'-phosphate oxidase family protein [Actinomycetota bacterium]